MLIANTGQSLVIMNLRTGEQVQLPPGQRTPVPDSKIDLIDDSFVLISLFNSGTLVAYTDAGAAYPGFPTVASPVYAGACLYSELPPADRNQGLRKTVTDRGGVVYEAREGRWLAPGPFTLHRQITFDATNQTPGNTTSPAAVAQRLIPRDCLARNGDIVRVHQRNSKNAQTDNGFVIFRFGSTGIPANDVNLSSSSTTFLSGANRSSGSYHDFMRVNATTLRRLGGGAGLTQMMGNAAADIPADFTVPNMDSNDNFLTITAYTATGGGTASAEVLSLSQFEIEIRPFLAATS